MTSLVFSSLFSLATAQTVEYFFTPEDPPPLTWQSCATANGCTTHNANLTADLSWRWLHGLDGNATDDCFFNGNGTWNPKICPDSATCTQSCAVEGASYRDELGVTTSGDSLSLKYYNKEDSTYYLGSRLFLLKDDTHYQTFNLLNQEFSFDVDVSKLPCGIQGALYFVGMDADGGSSRYPTNTAGAKFGTGYCDATCPRYLKFINGKANVDGWVPSLSDRYHDSGSVNSGYGAYGSCCSEIDIFNSNRISTSMNIKPCENAVQTRCVGDTCGLKGAETYQLHDFGECDHSGCDFNPYRLGNTSFYGPGKTVDTTKVFTVTTQFLTSDGTAQGSLTEIKRFYTQGGVQIANAEPNIPGVTLNSLSSDFCDMEKTALSEPYGFKVHGGWNALTDAMRNGMVLTMMVWNDRDRDLLWLDGTYPVNASGPGVASGSCPSDEASLDGINDGSGREASVSFSRIRFGDIGTTA